MDDLLQVKIKIIRHRLKGTHNQIFFTQYIKNKIIAGLSQIKKDKINVQTCSSLSSKFNKQKISKTSTDNSDSVNITYGETPHAKALVGSRLCMARKSDCIVAKHSNILSNQSPNSRCDVEIEKEIMYEKEGTINKIHFPHCSGLDTKKLKNKEELPIPFECVYLFEKLRDSEILISQKYGILYKICKEANIHAKKVFNAVLLQKSFPACLKKDIQYRLQNLDYSPLLSQRVLVSQTVGKRSSTNFTRNIAIPPKRLFATTFSKDSQPCNSINPIFRSKEKTSPCQMGIVLSSLSKIYF